MSFRGGSRFGARANVRGPSQIFKKRTELINTAIPGNSNATLLSTIKAQETGTVYAAIVNIGVLGLSSLASDVQRIAIYVRCVAEDTALPDLTDLGEIETMNGFLCDVLQITGGAGQPANNSIHTKFRFRRKCDRNMDIELIGQSTNTSGTNRAVDVAGAFSLIFRVR